MENKNKQTVDNIIKYFDEGYACSTSILLGFSKEFGVDERSAKLISSTFGGGMGRLRKTCGAVTGAYMVLGLKYGNEEPEDMETKLNSYAKVKELTAKFEKVQGTSNCKEILKNYATNAEIKEHKHHKIICRKVVGQVAEILCEMIYSEAENSLK